jgi:hypothetical protein
MIQALGYSQTPFHPDKAGRLCRGRERWIDPWETEPDEIVSTMHRVVFSGAAFSDDGAADARRGVPFSGIELATLINTLFARRPLLGWMEDGHPADIPDEADNVEAYEAHRGGGTTELGVVRWTARVNGVQRLRDLIGDGPLPDERVRGFAVLDGDGPLPDGLVDSLFTLCGFATLDSPPAYYQPLALPEVLKHVKALMLLHRDKHGPALGIYLSEPMTGLDVKLAKLCEKTQTLLVPFAIPPMLARWDRALAELRTEWMNTRSDEFPVPAAPSTPAWDRRRRRDNHREVVEVAEE